MKLPAISTILLGATFASAAFDGLSQVTTNSLQALAKRSLISDILADIEDATTCAGCESLLVVLKTLAALGNTEFVDVIVNVCQDLGVEDDDVCAGAIGLEGPILAHDLRQMTVGTKTSELFCLTIFGLCQWPDVDTSFTLDLGTKPDTSRPAPSGKTPIQVVHFSDIHVDLNYTVGASYNCTKNICCRVYEADDAVGVTDTPAGVYGNTACDSPLSLEESMYDAIKAQFPDRSFTIFTGDVVEGAVWLVTDTEVTNDLNNATSTMASLLGGQIYPVMGNHDAVPVNSFPPAAVDTTESTDWAYDTLSTDWESWIGSAASTTVAANFGSYSVLDSSGVRIISVNTNFWYKQNFWLYEATMEHDPSSMLSWLTTELLAAEAAGERVWLMGHMPLGASDAFHDQSYYFDTIIQRFDATIAAVFYGHTHKDEFEIAYSDYTNQDATTATMMSYIAGALTPTSGNPTFRVYDVDPVTFAVLDMHVYYANITSATYQTGPTWELLYSAKALYGAALGVTDVAAELTPAFWHNLTALFETDDDLFQTYYAYKNRNYEPASCDSDCKTAEICQLRAAQSQYNCVTVSAGINFKHKRDSTTDTAHVDECDGSRAAPVLAQLLGSGGLSSLKSALVSVVGEGFLSTTIPTNYTVNGTLNF